ncbi:MAG: polysaccharide biosynthesis tyrosine autokinase [Dysgonamonadaceae bacterium]|nr:polysaccharide biosynthesis tyrosine autokinase [Dysgonamonadaceae bacterium]
MKLTKSEEEFKLLSEKSFDFIGLFIKYLSFWKWFVISLIICTAIAVIYVKFSLPVYKIETSVLFQDSQKGSGSSTTPAFDGMGLITQTSNVENEMEMLGSSLIADKVVRELENYTSYTQLGSFLNIIKYKKEILYGNQSPIHVTLSDAMLDQIGEKPIVFEVLLRPNGIYEFSGKHLDKSYTIKSSLADSDAIMFPFGEVHAVKTGFTPKEEMLLEVVIQPPLNVADQFINSLEMEVTSKTSSVVTLSLNSRNALEGKEFMEHLVEVYNREMLSEQLNLADKTSQIIDTHLSQLSDELSTVDSQAEDYKQSQGITDIANQSHLYNVQTSGIEQRKMDIETQLAIVSDLFNSVQNQNPSDQLLPANSGISSESLNSMITSYNNLVMEKTKLSRVASSSNQAMIDLSNQIESMYRSVRSSLQNEKSNLQIALRDLSGQLNVDRARLRAVPRQQRVYSDITRQQGVKESLFLFLLQKKEEKYMNMATAEPNAKLIDYVRILGIVTPNKILSFLIAVALGLLVPIIIIRIKELMRYQIGHKQELAEISNVPLLGEIPKILETSKMVIKEDDNDGFTEMVRLLRTNLLFVIDSVDKKVINMVSSISGEGKTFVAINLATSLSLLDKKVLIIELDIRKPKFGLYFDVPDKGGMTMFLSGHQTADKLIKPSGIHPNLFMINAGPIAPNPNELLAKPSLDELIKDLRKQFDFIIIDTAPVGLVSDSLILNRIADINLYIVRADYTPKRNIEDATTIYNEEKLKNMYFILNSVDFSKRNYRYGYGKRYGYGYSLKKGSAYGYKL